MGKERMSGLKRAKAELGHEYILLIDVHLRRQNSLMAHEILINYLLSDSLAADMTTANRLLILTLGEIQNLHMQN